MSRARILELFFFAGVIALVAVDILCYGFVCVSVAVAVGHRHVYKAVGAVVVTVEVGISAYIQVPVAVEQLQCELVVGFRAGRCERIITECFAVEACQAAVRCHPDESRIVLAYVTHTVGRQAVRGGVMPEPRLHLVCACGCVAHCCRRQNQRQDMQHGVCDAVTGLHGEVGAVKIRRGCPKCGIPYKVTILVCQMKRNHAIKCMLHGRRVLSADRHVYVSVSCEVMCQCPAGRLVTTRSR